MKLERIIGIQNRSSYFKNEKGTFISIYISKNVIGYVNASKYEIIGYVKGSVKRYYVWNY